MVWTNVILLSIYSRSAAVLRMISGVKSARFGIENVGQPETVTITETLRMSSVLPTVLLLAWLVHWESPAWSVGLPALQYRGRQQTISSLTTKIPLRVHYTF